MAPCSHGNRSLCRFQPTACLRQKDQCSLIEGEGDHLGDDTADQATGSTKKTIIVELSEAFKAVDLLNFSGKDMADTATDQRKYDQTDRTHTHGALCGKAVDKK